MRTHEETTLVFVWAHRNALSIHVLSCRRRYHVLFDWALVDEGMALSHRCGIRLGLLVLASYFWIAYYPFHGRRPLDVCFCWTLGSRAASKCGFAHDGFENAPPRLLFVFGSGPRFFLDRRDGRRSICSRVVVRSDRSSHVHCPLRGIPSLPGSSKISQFVVVLH